MEKIENIEDIQQQLILYRESFIDIEFNIQSYYKLTFFKKASGWYEIEAKTLTTSKVFMLPPDSTEETVLEVYNDYLCELCEKGFKILQ